MGAAHLKLVAVAADNRAMTKLKIATVSFVIANAGIAVLASNALAFRSSWG